MMAMNTFPATKRTHAIAFPGSQFLEEEAVLAAEGSKPTTGGIDLKPVVTMIDSGSQVDTNNNITLNGIVTKNIKRKRFRWEEDPETNDVKRRVVDMPHLPSSQFTKSEKAELWMQKHDYEQTLTTALSDVVAAKSSAIPLPADAANMNGNKLPIQSYYAGAMAQTYSLCCSPGAQSSIALENVALLSLLDSSYRGLENHTLPREMRVDRKVRKAKTVSRVLELQGELRVAGNPDEDATECLRLVSEYFSEPSRKFARALGEIDGTFVHLES